MKQIILGIGHKARHGKDTAAAAILSHYARKTYYTFEGGPGQLKTHTISTFRVGFADELYRICREEYGMTGKDAPLLQRIGAERRYPDSEYWIKKAFAKIPATADIVVIPDVRYRNEAAYIKAQGGYLLKISRLNADGSLYVDDSRPADHPSEIELDGYTGWDLQVTIANGQQALTGELAVAYTEYLRGLHS